MGHVRGIAEVAERDVAGELGLILTGHEDVDVTEPGQGFVAHARGRGAVSEIDGQRVRTRPARDPSGSYLNRYVIRPRVRS